MTKLITTLNGRFEVRKVGCGRCGRGVDEIQFYDTLGRLDTQCLTGEVAEAIWPMIEAEATRNSAAFRAKISDRI